MDNKQKIYEELQAFNLTKDEAKLYVTLLEKPNTHLQLARTTGINRTKVYRVVEQLEKRGFVSRRTDDRGTFLVASDPKVLELEVVAEEEKLKHRQSLLKQVIPSLRSYYWESESPFAIYTYEGVEGLRQMQWHELKTKGELLTFGNTTIEDMVVDHRWAEKMRALAVERGYRTREIYNDPRKKPDFTRNQGYIDLYAARWVPESDLPIATPLVIYNDTVTIFQLTNEKRVGVEIVNEAFARTMKSVFEHYWRVANNFE